MDIGNAIAMYAAVVATGAALWPVWQARRARRPPVEVALAAAIVDDGKKKQRSRLVVIEVRNHGALQIGIRAVGLTDGKAMWTFQPQSVAVGPLEGPRIELHIGPQDFPHEVPPQESAAFPLPERFVQLGKDIGPMLGSSVQAEGLALDLDRPLAAWVWLGTGQEVGTRARLDWSDPWVVASDPWAIDEDEEPDEPEGPTGQGSG